MEKIEHDYKLDAVRLGWALFHFTIVSIFLAGLYLCIAVWRVSEGRSFKITAPIVWDKPALPEILGDADGMDETPTKYAHKK